MYVGGRVVGVGVRAQDDGSSTARRAERKSRRAAHRVHVENAGVSIIQTSVGGPVKPMGIFDGFGAWWSVNVVLLGGIRGLPSFGVLFASGRALNSADPNPVTTIGWHRTSTWT